MMYIMPKYSAIFVPSETFDGHDVKLVGLARFIL